MTKVRVTSMFHDKTDYSRVFEIGKVYDFDDEARVRTIVERGLGVIVETEKQEEKEPTVDMPVVKHSEEKAQNVETTVETVDETPKAKPVTRRKTTKRSK